MGFFDRLKQLKRYEETVKLKQNEVQKLDDEIISKKNELDSLQKDIEKADFEKIEKIKIINSEIEAVSQKKQKIIDMREEEVEKTRIACQDVINSYEKRRNDVKEKYEVINAEYAQMQIKEAKLSNNLELLKEKIKLYKAFIKNVSCYITDDKQIDNNLFDELCPTVELHLNSHDVKDLKALNNENNKIIDKVLEKYKMRYTTKSNIAIYQLMVIALRAELQNILVDLKYSNIAKSKENLNKMIDKFMTIASDGNQQIAPTIRSFINEIHILFEQSIDIEYTYWVRKEQERAEQQALKEQMRQEAEERRILEAEHKKVEKEESKYKSEIAAAEEMLANCTEDNKTAKLLERIEELKKLLLSVEEKKEEIINRQNGKAGYVYVISNLGSFGGNRFKVGMTRRLEPMDRVRELGDASVPFAFDVHSFIFSDDAVNLEKELHNRLNDRRTNKINMRKEFFDISIKEIENLVNEICPTAEFKETMLALEYRRGLELSNK